MIRYIDLFCGIGGFRYASDRAFRSLGIQAECVFSSDIDKYAQQAYEANFGEKPAGDFTWQPSGSQFTIIEDIPEDRMCIKVKKPERLNKDEVLTALHFDKSWYEIL